MLICPPEVLTGGYTAETAGLAYLKGLLFTDSMVTPPSVKNTPQSPVYVPSPVSAPVVWPKVHVIAPGSAVCAKETFGDEHWKRDAPPSWPGITMAMADDPKALLPMGPK